MSFWTSIRGGLTKVVSAGINLGTSALGGFLGGPAGAVAGSAVAAELTAPNPPVTTAGTGAGGLTQTLPVIYRQGGLSGAPGVGGGTPPTALSQYAAQAGSMARQYLTGQTIGPAGRRMVRGRITGNAIPPGYIEKMSPAGVVYLGKRRTRRGITGKDLASFRRVSALIHKYSHQITARRRK